MARTWPARLITLFLPLTLCASAGMASTALGTPPVHKTASVVPADAETLSGKKSCALVVVNMVARAGLPGLVTTAVLQTSSPTKRDAVSQALKQSLR